MEPEIRVQVSCDKLDININDTGQLQVPRQEIYNDPDYYDPNAYNNKEVRLLSYADIMISSISSKKSKMNSSDITPALLDSVGPQGLKFDSTMIRQRRNRLKDLKLEQDGLVYQQRDFQTPKRLNNGDYEEIKGGWTKSPESTIRELPISNLVNNFKVDMEIKKYKTKLLKFWFPSIETNSWIQKATRSKLLQS